MRRGGGAGGRIAARAWPSRAAQAPLSHSRGELAESLVVRGVRIRTAVPDRFEEVRQLSERILGVGPRRTELDAILAGRTARDVGEYAVLDERADELAVARSHRFAPLSRSFEALRVGAPVACAPPVLQLDRKLVTCIGVVDALAAEQVADEYDQQHHDGGKDGE